MSTSSSSPLKFDPITLGAVSWGVGALGTIASGIWGAKKAKEIEEETRKKEDRARANLQKMKQAYASLDTSNPYLNMENKMEDLTVNQLQAEFEAQQFQQSQANIMDTMRGAAGGSGIAALAQSLSQQGQLASQKAAASIGAQESRNQSLEAQEASRIQMLQRQGDRESQQMEMQKTATMLGMTQQEAAALHQQRMMAQQQATGMAAEGFGSVLDSITSGLNVASQMDFSSM
tara:strand:- start:960 stop:1655 length:696 start_codon:yes stop_codon:yes gene_type:complete